MKVVFFSSYYPGYLTALYKKNKELASKPYNLQLESIMKDYFGVFTSYVEYFRKIGVDASLIIPNCKPLQKAWANENDVDFNERNWLFALPLKQIQKANPDIFYISSMFEYYGEFLDEVRSFSRKIYGWISCEIPKNTHLNQIELLFTSVPYYVDDFRKSGIPSEYINAAFNPEILKIIGPVKPDIDFSFIGSLTHDHQNRIKFIKELMDHTNLQFFGAGLKYIPDDRNIFKRIFSENKYQLRAKEQVWGLDMFRALQRSRITFNNHIDISREYIGNMRMYEATGIGTLLLTDGKNAPYKNFNDDEVAYYYSVEEAIEKANYYIAHEAERAAIAKKGQQRTL